MWYSLSLSRDVFDSNHSNFTQANGYELLKSLSCNEYLIVAQYLEYICNKINDNNNNYYVSRLLSLSPPFPPSPSLSPSLPPSLLVVVTLLPLSGEYERVQKKAFTNWVNSHLIKVGLFSLPLVLIVVGHFTHYHSGPVESHQPPTILYTNIQSSIIAPSHSPGPHGGPQCSFVLCILCTLQAADLVAKEIQQ